jgi:hypothetical protein
MEFIPTDDEKGPGLRLKHKREAGQAGRDARQISLSGRDHAQGICEAAALIYAITRRRLRRWLNRRDAMIAATR